jgi:Fic family protein
MQRFIPQQPYNSLPLLPPQADVETHAILKHCIEARAAMAELKQAGRLIPDQGVLINSIPYREARDSSEIENIVTTTDRLFRYAATNDATADAATKETLRYRTALYDGYMSLRHRPLSTATAVAVCGTIKGTAMEIRRTPGTALKNEASNQIIYMPPEGESRLRDMLSNWERYMHEERAVDPLVRMAVAHYQFEAIHPFTDGNGRTGRILNILYLISEGLLDIPVLYLSRYIVQHKDAYYDKLLRVTTDAEWEPWIIYMLKAIEATSHWTREKILAIAELISHACDYTARARPSLYRKELIETVFQQPYCRISYLVDAGIAKRATASRYLKELAEIGILEEVQEGREKIFTNPKFMALLMQDSHTFSPYGEQHVI